MRTADITFTDIKTIALEAEYAQKLKDARELVSNKQFKKALEIYYECITAYPMSWQVLYEAASCLIQYDFLKEARQIAQIGLETFKDHPAILDINRVVCKKLYLFDDAKEYTKRVYEIDPNNRGAFINYVLTFAHTDNKESMFQSIQSFINNRDLSSEDYNSISCAIANMGLISESIQLLRKTLEKITQEPLPKKQEAGKLNTDITRQSLLLFKAIFDSLELPFALGHGTLLGVYRDGNILSGEGEIDVYMPFAIDKIWLAENLKKCGCIVEQSYEELKSPHNLTMGARLEKFKKYVIEISFLKPQDNHLIMGFNRGDKEIHLKVSPFEFIHMNFIGESFLIPKDTALHLSEVYGKDWNKRTPNRNFFIYGENIIDPHHIRICYALNHIAGKIHEGLFKKGHGLILQLMSIYEDPLLYKVKEYLEENIDEDWYPPLPINPNIERLHYREVI